MIKKCNKCEFGTLERCHHKELNRTVWGCDECKNYVDLGNLFDDLNKVYEKLPKVTGNACEEKCKSGQCKFYCCSVTGCSGKEKHLINRYIKEFELDLSYVNNKDGHGNSTLPNNYAETKDLAKTKCEYIGEHGCKIYEIRPAICRLFGACKQMSCSFFPEQAVADYPIRKMVDIGFFNKDILEQGGGIERFNNILNSL